MNGVTVLSKKELDFKAIYNEIIKKCPKTTFENDVMINGKSIHKWYFYNLPDISSDIFDVKDLVQLPNEPMFCYELSYRNSNCPLHILMAIQTIEPSSYIFDDILDQFMKINDYIAFLNKKITANQ